MLTSRPDIARAKRSRHQRKYAWAPPAAAKTRRFHRREQPPWEPNLIPSTTTTHQGVHMLSSTPRTFIGSTTFTVNGMTCSHCQRAVTEEIAAVDGVESVTVDLASG